MIVCLRPFFWKLHKEYIIETSFLWFMLLFTFLPVVNSRVKSWLLSKVLQSLFLCKKVFDLRRARFSWVEKSSGRYGIALWHWG